MVICTLIVGTRTVIQVTLILIASFVVTVLPCGISHVAHTI